MRVGLGLIISLGSGAEGCTGCLVGPGIITAEGQRPRYKVLIKEGPGCECQGDWFGLEKFTCSLTLGISSEVQCVRMCLSRSLRLQIPKY